MDAMRGATGAGGGLHYEGKQRDVVADPGFAFH